MWFIVIVFGAIFLVLILIFLAYLGNKQNENTPSNFNISSSANKKKTLKEEPAVLGNNVFVDREAFIKEYMNCIPFELYIDLSERSLKVASIEKAVYDEIVKRKREQDYFNQSLSQTVSLNNDGISLEKEGKIQEAIAIYEENIKSEYPATHSYNRLMILYRKLKQRDDEIRVIKEAIKVFSKENERRKEIGITNLYDIDKWKKRLEKLM